jgi:uncharacterized protein YndB with AHSA1/START domain
MEYASIEREILVNAAPEIVYEVVSSPEHITEWWPDEADYSGVVGESGSITFLVHGEGPVSVPLTVVVADPPRTFSFRWTQDAGEEAVTGNSLLVSFELVPQGSGTLVKLTETGFREMGWEAAKLEAVYADHVTGWSHHVPRLGEYVDRLVAKS